jgi:hypothetical protein
LFYSKEFTSFIQKVKDKLSHNHVNIEDDEQKSVSREALTIISSNKIVDGDKTKSLFEPICARNIKFKKKTSAPIT